MDVDDDDDLADVDVTLFDVYDMLVQEGSADILEVLAGG